MICRGCGEDTDTVLVGAQDLCAGCMHKGLLKLGSPFRGKDLPKGVSAIATGYKAQLRMGEKTKHLGVYGTPEEAHEAYIEARAGYLSEQRQSNG